MIIKQQLVSELTKVLQDLGVNDITPSVDYPGDPKHGDYSSNVALVAAKKLGKNPRELAEEIANSRTWHMAHGKWLEKIELAGPGFINFWINDKGFIQSVQEPGISKTSRSDKKIVVEYAHPNTHKAFHIGHLRNISTGEAVVRLLEFTGAHVVRVNYQGDVGMHIAKCIYGILQNSKFEIRNSNLNTEEKVELLGQAYAAGSKAFEEDEQVKKEIGEINKKIYAKDPSIWDLYQTTRQWSLDYFEKIYKRLGSHFDRYYFESEVYEAGKENVLKGLKQGIFVESEGAIIFPGKKFGLHDRVFITGEGNPTYEGKEMGLGPLQFKEYDPDSIIHVVGPEQAGYFQVNFEALAQLLPETRGKEFHLAYGWVKLKHGKMSSRTGNVVLGEWLLDEAKKEIYQILEKNRAGYTKEQQDEIAEQVAVAAVKYSFLRVSTAQEIAFDIEESVSFEGNSGPYIQYTFARTQSVIARSEARYQTVLGEATKQSHESGGLPRSFQSLAMTKDLEAEERELLKLLSRFPEIVEEAAERLSPNVLCTYLFETAQVFNLFYQTCPILKSEKEIQQFRLFLTDATGSVLKKGLSLLGIEAPEKM